MVKWKIKVCSYDSDANVLQLQINSNDPTHFCKIVKKKRENIVTYGSLHISTELGPQHQQDQQDQE